LGKAETNTTRGGARFFGATILRSSRHILIFGGFSVNPNHDATIRILSEAPKQRCPFSLSASKP
jgi:hypothetical protein